MKYVFENKGKWLKEAIDDDDDSIFGDDALDEIDEGLYVDPDNYGNYDDLVDVVDKDGNPQKMTRHTYDANKDSGEFKDAPKKDDSTQKAFEISDLKKQIANLEQVADRYKSMAMAAGRSGRGQQALNMYRSALDSLDRAKATLAEKTAEYKDSDSSTSDKPKALNDFKTILDLPGNGLFDKSYSMIDQYEKENPDVSDEDKIKFFQDTKEALNTQFNNLHARGDEAAWEVKKAFEVLDEATDMVEENVYFKNALSNLGDTKDITNELPKELSKRLKRYFKKYSQTSDKRTKNIYTSASKDMIYRYAKDLSKFDSDTLVNYFKAVAPGLKDVTLNKIASFGKA